MSSGIALGGQTDPLSIPGAGFDPDLQRLRPLNRSLSVAGRARGNVLSRPVAARALYVELHSPARLLDRPFAVALRTRPRCLNESVSVACRAGLPVRDVELHHSAANRRPKRNIDLVLEIRTRLRSLFRGYPRSSAIENTGENIAKASTACRTRRGLLAPASTFEQVGKIESAKVEMHAACARGTGCALLPPGKSTRGAALP